VIILDTDCLSIFEREKHLDSMLRANLAHFDSADISTTIVTFEEQMRGWMAFLSKSKSLQQQIIAYKRLNQFLENFRKIHVFPFDEKAAKIFDELKSRKIRVGTMDLKIASIAIANEAILISRNLSDFEKVPNLKVQDWTK
jgi:tRNA(fMet)-specific endonuclease VapC